MRDLIQDLQYGLRVFAKNPTFTLVALLALALGIGATTAIFSVVDTVLLKPLPYPRSDRIVSVGLITVFGSPQFPVALMPDYLEWRARNHVFEEMAAYSSASRTLTGAGEPTVLKCGSATQSFFRTFRIQPILGRAFTRAEDQPGAPRVVLLTYGMWQRNFGGARDVLGKSLTLDGVPHTVVGVLAPAFRFRSSRIDALLPMAIDEARQAKRDPILIRPVVARLKDGVTIVQAQAEIQALLEQIKKAHPGFYQPRMTVSVVPLLEQQVGNVRLTLLALLGAVALVLLIACANVANLLLSRSASRQREIALRAAMGAGRARLVRQLLTENALLGLAGGLLGLLLAALTLKSIIHFAPSIPRIEDVSIDLRVLGFSLLTSFLVSLLVGLTPALGSTRVDLSEALKQSSRGASASHRGLRSLLIIGELALSLVLLVGAGLLIQTLWRLLHVNTGFAAEHVLTTQISLSENKYSEQAQRALVADLRERVSKLPGVLSAALSDALPLSNAVGMPFNIQGTPRHGIDEPAYEINARSVSSTYFAVLGIPLRSGRLFTSQDAGANAKTALVNETLARRFFPQGDAIGKSVGTGFDNNWSTIVGVVSDVKNHGLAEPPGPELYYLDAVDPYDVPSTLLVRGVGDPLALVAEVRDQIHSIDKNIPLTFTTMTHEIDDLVSSQRFNSILLSSFAGLALLLAAIGIYGVMSYMVTQRTQEIGIRMALGARRGNVLGLVVGHAFRLTLAGVIVGIALALGLTRYLATLVYGVSTRDAWTFSSVGFLLIVVALLASYVPAQRATRVDPSTTLRAE
jgi:putative ABC transport system permease protein